MMQRKDYDEMLEDKPKTRNFNLDDDCIQIVEAVAEEYKANLSWAARHIIREWARCCRTGILLNTNTPTGNGHEETN